MIGKRHHRLDDSRGLPEKRKRQALTIVELLIVLAIFGVTICFLLPATSRSREAARRTQCKNNLKQNNLAVHNYESTYHSLPPAYTVDANGERLHSWRTLILPFLDQQQLYESIDLSKPWNHPANAKAMKTTVHAFCCPSNDCPRDRTTYLAVVASNSCFRPIKSKSFSEITAPANETLMVIEIAANDAIPWMSPVDADEELVLGLGQIDKPGHRGVHLLFVDGSIGIFDSKMPALKRLEMISASRNDHEPAKH